MTRGDRYMVWCAAGMLGLLLLCLVAVLSPEVKCSSRVFYGGVGAIMAYCLVYTVIEFFRYPP